MFLLFALFSASAQAAPEPFGLSNFFAGTCNNTGANSTGTACNDNNSTPESEYYTQAGGPPNYGTTEFQVETKEDGEPVQNIKNVRVDIPPGLHVNPTAIVQCPLATFESDPLSCPQGEPGSAGSSELGTNTLTVCPGLPGIPCPVKEKLSAIIYNLVPPNGDPAAFGFGLGPKDLGLLIGHNEWHDLGPNDYHDYFTIEAPEPSATSPIQLVGSRLTEDGNIGNTGRGPFISLPDTCTPPPISYIEYNSYQNPTNYNKTSYTDPTGPSGCDLIPFGPSFNLTPETTVADVPDGIKTELDVPQNPSPTAISTSDLQNLSVVFPEGMTLNPSAAHGLGVCTPEEIDIGGANAVTCPEASKLGTVKIEAPELPPGSLSGALYLGDTNPGAAPITAPPYTVYLDVESARYGESVRLAGEVKTNPETGQVTIEFVNNPQLPFSKLTLEATSGPLASLGNPISCGAATTKATLTPYFDSYVEGSQPVLSESSFDVTPNGPSCLPFAWSQSSSETSQQADGFGSFSFELARADGQQYIKETNVVLPPGFLGLIANVPLCTEEEATANECPADSQIGEVTTTAGAGSDPYSFTGKVYLTGPYGGGSFGLYIAVPSAAGPFDFGTIAVREALKVNTANAQVTVSGSVPTIIEGVPLRLRTINVTINRENFLLNPSACGSTSVNGTLTSVFGALQESTSAFFTENCSAVPFSPSVSVSPETKTAGAPDGADVDLKVPQFSEGINSSAVQNVSLTLPEGMTLNPSAANGLQACTLAELGINTANPVTCPAAAEIGTVLIETPTVPVPLTGHAYLGEKEAGVITGGPYSIFIVAEAPAYNLSVRLAGVVTANPNTGQLTTTFMSLPQAPFSNFSLQLTAGAKAPLANPIVCSTVSSSASLLPFSSSTAATPTISPFAVEGCAAPFALAQSTSSSTSQAGAFTSFTFNLHRPDNQQYLSKISTTLPPGLVGLVASVPRCGAVEAAAGTCGAASQIGTATASAGSGSNPVVVSGPVYLTGPYGGGPYGLSVVLPTAVGPFNFGPVVVQSAITVNPYTAQVTVTSNPLPTIIQGVPLRVQSLSIAINHPSFLLNPTSCAAFSVESTPVSEQGLTQSLSSPFQVSGCGNLGFTPQFTATASANASKNLGAALKINITQGFGQSNIRSTVTTLPVQLPSRLTTLQKACLAKTFEANPASCPSESSVGVATVTTPVLPEALVGKAYLVSYGGAAFPNLNIVLHGDGLEIILIGNTHISTKGITTTTFQSLPDAPISSFSLDLPEGPFSILGVNGNLCSQPLYLPTVLTGQNGTVDNDNVPIKVTGCPASKMKVIKVTVKNGKISVKVSLPGPGTISLSGKYLKKKSERVTKAKTITIRTTPSAIGKRLYRRNGKLKVHLRISFASKTHGASSVVTKTETFKAKRR